MTGGPAKGPDAGSFQPAQAGGKPGAASRPRTGETPELEVIVVTHNSRHWIGDCLESVAPACGRLSHRVTVVDSGSTDGTQSAARDWAGEATVVELDCNRGYGAALNHGLRRAGAPFMACCNADVRLEPQCLERLVEAVRAAPRACAAGPLLVDGQARAVSSARGFPTLASEAFESGLVHRVWRSNPIRRAAWRPDLGPGRGGPCDWLVGAVLVLGRRAVEEVGLFDESYFLYFEETDWFRRAAAQGYTAWYVPEAVAVHPGGGSTASGEGALTHFWTSQRRYHLRHEGPARVAVMTGFHASGCLLRLALWAGRRLLGHGADAARAQEAREAVLRLEWLLGRRERKAATPGLGRAPTS